MLALAIVIASSLFIPSVQAFTISAMSIFRIGDARAITITIMDIEKMASYLAEHQEMFCQLRGGRPDASRDAAKHEHSERDMSRIQLDDISQFGAFPVRLPRALSGETPALFASEDGVTEVTLNISAMNAFLAQFRDMPHFDESLNGAVLEIHAPPVLVAEYEDAGLIVVATQMMHIEASVEVKESLRNTLLAMPFISENLRGQLAAIPLLSRDIYLPVIAGFGREVSIGNRIGYIYTASDLSALFGQMAGTLLPHDAVEPLWERTASNASILVWVQDGVVYILAGPHSDSELVRLARNMR